ncbi:MAG: carbohydrate binding family 9 domain-containing protein [Acidobacteria bacterium]|nr:carbohydrate binding family 9 domain-containing protein [Acidobacteriota bacterium]
MTALALPLAAPARAQSAAPSAPQGSPAPDAGAGSGGATAVRSSDGRLVLTAVEASGGIRVDGALDDEAWEHATPVSGFLQSEPAEGQPATQQTEVRIAYDQNNLYIAAFCRDDSPLVITDIRKDFGTGDQDTFEVIIDTFGDHNNGFIFATNPEGARSDSQVTNEGREVNTSWDAVWNVRTRKVDQGWTIEMGIPFRSLRFEGGVEKVWGINFSRRLRRVNEVTYWSLVPRQFKISRVSLAGDLEGIPARMPSRNLRIKPYVLASSVRPTGSRAVPAPAFAGDGDIGLDLKYGVSSSLTLDVMVNPDFAQAEADQQQVNLTQFDLFYPEKRDFFLENSGVFYVGDASRALVGNQVTTAARADTDLYYFHSRRIGLTDDGQPIPILAGARLTGQAGGLGIGVLSVQVKDTASSPNNHYTVARLRKGVLNNTAFFGGILMQRQNTDASGDYNRVVGIDTNIRLFGRVDTSASYFNTLTGAGNPLRKAGSTRWDQSSLRASYLFEGRKYYSNGTMVTIGKDFNDELGYYRRLGIRKYILDTGMRPRPKALNKYGIRELQPHLTWNYFTDMEGRYFARNLHTAFSIYGNSGSSLEFSMNPGGDTLFAPQTISGIRVPAGTFRTNNFRVNYSSDPSRLFSGGLTTTVGTNWIADEQTISANLTLKPSYRFRTTLSAQRTRLTVDDPAAPQNALRVIVTNRTNYSFTTNMFVDALIQFEQATHRVNSNIRFNFIHHPLSDLYIVYNDQRFTDGAPLLAGTDAPPVAGRGLIVKFTQMFSF